MSFINNIKNNIKESKEREEEKLLIEQNEDNEQFEGFPDYSLFDFVDCLTINKISWEQLGPKNQKKLQLFMLNKVFSMIPEFSQVLNEIQMHQKVLTTEMVYKFWFYFLPQERFSYKYIKETPKQKIDSEIVKIFKDYFKESEKNIYKYYNLLTYDSKVELLQKYGMNNEKIEKLLNGND